MRYYQSDFLHENAFLRRSPKNAKEAYNKLSCLAELEERRGLVDNFIIPNLSKRRERLVKTYWAFKRIEAEKI